MVSQMIAVQIEIPTTVKLSEYFDEERKNCGVAIEILESQRDGLFLMDGGVRFVLCVILT